MTSQRRMNKYPTMANGQVPPTYELIDRLPIEKRVCAKCGKHDEELKPDGKHRVHLTADHIKPISMGGKNELSNIQLVCRECNMEKGNKYEPD